MSLVDIYIPTYEPDPEHLGQALDSLLAQTEQRWHAYIHDDASKADVKAMVEPYLKDKRFSFSRSTKRLGIGGNWNACLPLGSSPFIQYLFQDDWWEPHFLEAGVQAMNEFPGVGIVSLGHDYVCTEGSDAIPLYKELEQFRSNHLSPGVHDGKELLLFWLEHELHPNIVGEPDFVMLRRSVVHKAGKYLEDMPQNLDMEYALRCLMHGDWYYVDDVCGHFRVHTQAASAVNQREGTGIFDRFRCFERVIRLLPKEHDKKIAIKARNRALDDMAGKFLNRVKSGGRVQTKSKGSNSFKVFALKHPLLVTRTLIRAMRRS